MSATKSITINNSGDLARAIEQSIQYNISIDINGATVDEVNDMAFGLEVEDVDHAELEDGVYDVWGEMGDGSEFRLTLTEAR